MRRIFPSRTYPSGTGVRWCFWRWSDAQEPYLTRLFLIKTPWFAICLNHIKAPDSGDPHDHTSAFFSIFLRGWYVERRVTNWNGTIVDSVRRVQFFNYMRGCDWDAHRILSVPEGGMFTLCLMGPKVREWGYHTKYRGWILWSDYTP